MTSALLNGIRATESAPAKAVVRERPTQDTDLALMRADLRDAIAEAGWKHDALASELSAVSGLSIDGPYLSKILSGEKSLSAAHIAALPDDVEAIFTRRRAERFGAIVVPPVDGETAMKQLVSGLVGVLRGRRTA